MTQPYIGEVRMFGGSFAPLNWAFCNGQSVPISENTALFNLIGTTYGGDGQTTFNLPNLQGRLAVGVGQGPGLSPYTIGQVGGSETVTLTTATMASHSHSLSASKNTVTTNLPSGNLTGAGLTSPATAYFYTNAPTTGTGNLNNATVTNTGGNQPHPNLMPSQCVSFIIALYGIYPSQT
jgi:microcystin-dependent protein